MKKILLIVALVAMCGCARFEKAAQYELTEAEVELVEKVEEKVAVSTPFPWGMAAGPLVGVLLGYGIAMWKTRKKAE